MGWIWWVLGLLVLVGLIWWLAADTDEDDLEPLPEDEVVAPIDPAVPEASDDTIAGTVEMILASPEEYIGEEFPDATVQVAAVPTDRGFWIAGETDSLLAIIIDDPQEEPKDINSGQTLSITDGTLQDASYLPEMPGDPLEADTERLVEGESIFLLVDERYITIEEPGTPQAEMPQQ